MEKASRSRFVKFCARCCHAGTIVRKSIAGLRRSGRNRNGKDFCMARLRNAMMAVLLGTCVMGCSFAHWSPFHCDDCDDFPAPAHGPDFSMMPGSYTGQPPSENGGRASLPAANVPAGSGATPPSASGASQPVEEAPLPAPAPAPTPPSPPAVTPGMGAAAPVSSARMPQLASAYLQRRLP